MTSSRPPANIRDAMLEAQAIAGGSLRNSASPQPQVQVGRKTVLLVDGDAAARAQLRAALTQHYDVVEAVDGLDAADKLSTMKPPAMVVTEVAMSRVDGFTLAKILRNNPLTKKIPIMFVSSRNTPQDVTQALALGACQFITKPAAAGDIAAKIRKIVL